MSGGNVAKVTWRNYFCKKMLTKTAKISKTVAKHVQENC